MDRTITVEGEGSHSAAPDAVWMECSFQGRDKDHAQAVRMSAECVKPLRDALVSAGFPEDALKTVSVSVRPYYENRRDDDVYNTVFAGFEYSHRMRMEMSSDNDVIGRAMDAMLSTGVQFSMSYHLRDTAAAESAARQDAVRDAKAKAQQLAQVSGVRLGEIVSIRYGGPSADEPRTFRVMAANAGGPDMVPEDISFSDRVTISWQIL